MSSVKPDNVNVHRAAENIIDSKSRAARGSVCNVLLARDYYDLRSPSILSVPQIFFPHYIVSLALRTRE